MSAAATLDYFQAKRIVRLKYWALRRAGKTEMGAYKIIETDPDTAEAFQIRFRPFARSARRQEGGQRAAAVNFKSKQPNHQTPPTMLNTVDNPEEKKAARADRQRQLDEKLRELMARGRSYMDAWNILKTSPDTKDLFDAMEKPQTAEDVAKNHHTALNAAAHQPASNARRKAWIEAEVARLQSYGMDYTKAFKNATARADGGEHLLASNDAEARHLRTGVADEDDAETQKLAKEAIATIGEHLRGKILNAVLGVAKGVLVGSVSNEEMEAVLAADPVFAPMMTELKKRGLTFEQIAGRDT